jgi:hypothetical protein
MITQNENVQELVSGRTLVVDMNMKGWFARAETVQVLLSDLRPLQNHNHFGSTMFRAICAKHHFLQTKYNSIFKLCYEYLTDKAFRQIILSILGFFLIN